MKGFTTKIVHNDRARAIEHGSVHKPVHTSVAFAYDDARELAAVFQGTQPGYTYGRQVNPTVTALQDKITLMEQGVATAAFAPVVTPATVSLVPPSAVALANLLTVFMSLTMPI